MPAEVLEPLSAAFHDAVSGLIVVALTGEPENRSEVDEHPGA
jgi:hypothetical protein